MMKWILIGLAAVAAIIVGFFALGWYTMSKPIDPNSSAGQAYSESFKKEFAASCQTESEKAVGTIDDATRAKFTTLCTCAADAVYEQYKDQPPSKLLAIATDQAAQEAIGRIMVECGQQAGLQ